MLAAAWNLRGVMHYSQHLQTVALSLDLHSFNEKTMPENPRELEKRIAATTSAYGLFRLTDSFTIFSVRDLDWFGKEPIPLAEAGYMLATMRSSALLLRCEKFICDVFYSLFVVFS
mgnify:CR=1 FL=1